MHLPPDDERGEDVPAARVISTRGGSSWLVTVVARVASEDVATGAVSGRLIVRYECMSSPGKSRRIVTLRATSLDDLSDEALRGALSARIQGRAR
ncbi:MAG: hypothetical protein M3081_19555 [Gemmatimonadota bacterium]|nr:hypothetical protein [Gemmatimonadota bacterium]